MKTKCNKHVFGIYRDVANALGTDLYINSNGIKYHAVSSTNNKKTDPGDVDFDK